MSQLRRREKTGRELKVASRFLAIVPPPPPQGLDVYSLEREEPSISGLQDIAATVVRGTLLRQEGLSDAEKPRHLLSFSSKKAAA